MHDATYNISKNEDYEYIGSLRSKELPESEDDKNIAIRAKDNSVFICPEDADNPVDGWPITTVKSTNNDYSFNHFTACH